jgi:hypothetical protein
METLSSLSRGESQLIEKMMAVMQKLLQQLTVVTLISGRWSVWWWCMVNIN